MKNWKVILPILISLVIFLGLFVLASCQSNAEQITAANENETAQVIIQGNEASIIIQNQTFILSNIGVSVGTKVTWTNTDRMAHTVSSGIRGSSDAGKLFKGFMDTDQTFNYTFTKAGTYPYFCSIHPGDTGTVIVK